MNSRRIKEKIKFQREMQKDRQKIHEVNEPRRKLAEESEQFNDDYYLLYQQQLEKERDALFEELKSL